MFQPMVSMYFRGSWCHVTDALKGETVWLSPENSFMAVGQNLLISTFSKRRAPLNLPMCTRVSTESPGNIVSNGTTNKQSKKAEVSSGINSGLMQICRCCGHFNTLDQTFRDADAFEGESSGLKERGPCERK